MAWCPKLEKKVVRLRGTARGSGGPMDKELGARW
jgi:hypothetical protein